MTPPLPAVLTVVAAMHESAAELAPGDDFWRGRAGALADVLDVLAKLGASQ